MCRARGAGGRRTCLMMIDANSCARLSGVGVLPGFTTVPQKLDMLHKDDSRLRRNTKRRRRLLHSTATLRLTVSLPARQPHLFASASFALGLWAAARVRQAVAYRICAK